jgi:hypothetical protein
MMDRYIRAEDFVEEFYTAGGGPQLAMKMGVKGEDSQVLSRAIQGLALEIVAMTIDDRSDPVRVYNRYDDILAMLPYILTHPLYRDIMGKFPVHHWISF